MLFFLAVTGLVLDAPGAGLAGLVRASALRASTPSMQILISGKPDPPKRPSGLLITGPANGGGGGGLTGGGGGSSGGGGGLLSASGGSLLGADANKPKTDPLAVARPKYDLAPSTGRPDEKVFGASACTDAAEWGTWGEHMREKGIARVLALCDQADAGAMVAAICGDAGFGAPAVCAVDIRQPGAAAATTAAIQAARVAREAVIVIDAVGGARTALVLAQWLHDDYVGGDGEQHVCLEVCLKLVHARRAANTTPEPRQVADNQILRLMDASKHSAT